MDSSMSQCSRDAMSGLDSHPTANLLDRAYTDDESDGRAERVNCFYFKHCWLSPNRNDGGAEVSRSPWLRKLANHDEVDSFFSSPDYDDGQDSQIYHRANGERQKMMLEGERTAYKAKHDLRELFNIESTLAPCKPVKFDELSTFLESLESYGAQKPQNHVGSLGRPRANGKRWVSLPSYCDRKPSGVSDTSDDERKTCDIGYPSETSNDAREFCDTWYGC